MIFDEATSSLDSATEQEIQKSISELSQGRTVLKIAHDLNFIKNSENIVLLHSGSVVAQGDHAYLFQHSEAYRELWEDQK